MTDNGIHVKSSSTWVRLAYMLFFGLLIAVGRMVLGIVVLGQFLMVLITGNDNDNLRNLGPVSYTHLTLPTSDLV